jgi:hypothetical protein
MCCRVWIYYGRVIKGGQKYAAANHEESSRDKDSKAEGFETGFQVGQPHNVRKETRRPAIGFSATSRSSWLLDETREIPPNQSWFG